MSQQLGVLVAEGGEIDGERSRNGAISIDIYNSVLQTMSTKYRLTIQGKLNEAGTIFKRALAIREKALGPDHVHVAESLHNLAVVLSEQVNTTLYPWEIDSRIASCTRLGEIPEQYVGALKKNLGLRQ